MLTKKISLISLGLLIVGAIASIRNFPSTAIFGSSLIFFLIFAAIIFLIPIALVSAELSASFPDEGGVYHWVRRAFGEQWAMLAIWLQWINTMIWYPTILSFIGGTAAYLIDPALAQNKVYLISSILVIVWILTLMSIFGIQLSSRINDICASIGTVFPMLLLIGLGFYWVLSGRPLQIRLDAASAIPALTQSSNWVSLVAIMASFLGMELSGVHVSDIRNPQRNFPRAVLYAAAFILFVMMFGSLSIALVVPVQDIQLVSGVMQVFTEFFTAFGLEWCIKPLTVLIVIGAFGGIINWLISPARGLLHAGEFGFLPPIVARKNRYGVSPSILIAQAVVISLFCCAFLLLPSINGFYWFLMALSTEMYMIMYVLIFLSAFALRLRIRGPAIFFRIPGGLWGLGTVVFLGIFACLATIAVTFLPPDNVDIGSPTTYSLIILIGSVAAILPVFGFFIYKRLFSSVTVS
ncbi:MAG: gadC [Parachlamydiales bacterium]|nr:gadC [Parachlamydiales bacterium]